MHNMAGAAPKRPRHHIVNDSVEMENPDDKPRLMQNGGLWLLAELYMVSVDPL